MTFTSSAGEMTLYLELYDSVTGDLLAKALDRRVRSRQGRLLHLDQLGDQQSRGAAHSEGLGRNITGCIK